MSSKHQRPVDANPKLRQWSRAESTTSFPIRRAGMLSGYIWPELPSNVCSGAANWPAASMRNKLHRGRVFVRERATKTKTERRMRCYQYRT